MSDDIKKFSDWDLDEDLKKSIDDLGFESPTAIQDRAIPLVLAKKDLAGLAQTGTGKTAAFLIPMIERVLRSQKTPEHERAFTDWQENNFILILVPTRELVSQVTENFESLTKHSDLKSVLVYGGVGYDEQVGALKKDYQFVIATPGRLIDLCKSGHLDLKQVRAAVFDEADRMFDMGFQDDVFFILRRAPKDRQLLLFSATLNLHVTQMAYQVGSDPIEIDVSRDQATADNVDDFIAHVGQDEKPKYLLSIFKKHEPKQVIIFTNFKSKVQRVADFLNKNGYAALGISSLLSQSQRNTVMKKFKEENKHNILVATDVAARGLDIQGVDMVVNFELPDDAENYVHRIGRTGRADQKGQAFSFVSDKDVEALMRIEDYLKEKLEVLWLDDSDFVKEFEAFPDDRARRGPPRPRPGEHKRGGRDSRGKKPYDKTKRKSGPTKSRSAAGKYDDLEDTEEGRKDGERSRSARRPDDKKKSVHRDKRSGRHAKKTGEEGSKPANKKRRRKNNKKKSSSASGADKFANRRHYTRKVKEVPKPTLLGRLSKSVKSLFGSK